MDQYHRLKDTKTTTKSVTIGIIFLVIGVSIFSCTTQVGVTATQTKETIEITTQACGIKGSKDTIVQLTKEQYLDLERYLTEFREQLNHTNTLEDTIILFKDVVVELNKYGLLPKDMSIEQTQRLVTGRYSTPKTMKWHSLINRNQKLSNDSNFLCLLTGTTTSTCVIGIAEQGLATLIYLFYLPYFLEQIFFDDPVYIETILVKLRETCQKLQTLSSRRIIQTGNIIFGTSKEEYLPPEFRFFPAYGWVDTQGLLGKKSWNGTFFGSIRMLRSYEFRFYTYYIGATGFVGIRLYKADGKNFFIGSALRCDLDYFEY